MKLILFKLSFAPLLDSTFFNNMGTKPPAKVASVVFVDDMAITLPNAMTTIMTNMRKTTMIMNFPVAARRLMYTGPGAP